MCFCHHVLSLGWLEGLVHNCTILLKTRATSKQLRTELRFFFKPSKKYCPPRLLLRHPLEFQGDVFFFNHSTPRKTKYQHTSRIWAPVRETGVVIARILPYARQPTDTPTRTRDFLVHNWHVLIETRLVISRLLCPFSTRKSTSKGGTDYLLHLRNPTKHSFKCLFKDTLLWCGIKSTNLRNPKDPRRF